MTEAPFSWRKSQGLYLHNMSVAVADVIKQAAAQ
jgi:hypothetical protein